MRLWHEELLHRLPRQQLLGQHRECCALRGKGWGRKHSVVDYVFRHSPARLAAYHIRVMQEMERRGYEPEKRWYNPRYRGKNSPAYEPGTITKLAGALLTRRTKIFKEHDEHYLQECTQNLAGKGVIL